MTNTARSELRDNWPVLAGATVAMFSGATGLPLATSGMFITSLQSTFGWQRTAISFGPAIFMAGIALTTPIVGMLTERFDARKMVAIGMMSMVFCFFLLSRLQGDIMVFYLTYSAMAVVGNLSGAAALTSIVTRTFSVARGRALGISMAGAGVTTSVAGPVTYLVVQALGWRSGYLAVALFVLIMIQIVWVLLNSTHSRRRADTSASVEGASVRSALTGALYWWMMLAFFLISAASTGLIVHFVPLLADKGVTPQLTAILASAIGLTTILARLLSGVLVDRYDVRHVAAAAMIMSAVGFLLFIVGGAQGAIFGAAAVGISFGAETPLVGYMIARYYGMRNYGLLLGVIYGVVLSGAVFSPIFYAILRDRTGSYDAMIVIAIVLLVISAIILCLLPKPGKQTELSLRTELLLQ